MLMRGKHVLVANKPVEKIGKRTAFIVAVLLAFVLTVQPLGMAAYAGDDQDQQAATEETAATDNQTNGDTPSNDVADSEGTTEEATAANQEASADAQTASLEENNDYGIMPMGLLDGRSILDGTATINNAQVAYAYFTDETDAQNAQFVQVQNGDDIHIDCFATLGYIEDWSIHEAHDGYIVFFVKPNDSYLLTGLNADGSGDLYSLNGSLGELSDYPGIQQLVNKAKAEGYIAAFGYSRVSGNGADNDVDANFLVDGYKPALSMSATADKQQNVVPGDTLTFSVTVSPATQTDDNRPLTIEGVTLDSLTINGSSYTLDNVVRNSDGSITGTVQYVATEGDCNSGSVTLNAQVSVDYAYSFRGDVDNIVSRAKVTTSGQTTCTIAAKQGAMYSYSNTNLPTEVMATLPSDSATYYPGSSVTVLAPTVSRVDVESQNGYYTFNGWTVGGNPVQAGDTVQMTNNALYVVGSWIFTEYSDLSDQSLVTVTAPKDTTYNGSSQTLKPTVETPDGSLQENVDYTLSWSDAVNAGPVTVTVTGTGNYRGSQQVSYEINPAELTAIIADQSKIYDGTTALAEDPEVNLSGVIGNDDVTATIAAENVSFAQEGAHTHLPLQANPEDVVLDGAQSGNYVVTGIDGYGTITRDESGSAGQIGNEGDSSTDTNNNANSNAGNNASDAENNSTANDEESEGLAQTGDSAMLGIVALIALLAAAGVAFAAYKNRRPRGRHMR